MRSVPEARGPPVGVTAIVLGLLAIRLALAAGLPLTEDEAYYRLWAQAPALGYFDHPPMIAWWIRLGSRIAGDGALGVRLLPCLACAASSLLVFDLARRLTDSRRVAARASVWFNATLLVAAGGFLAVPDAAASFFWTLCLCAVARAARRPPDTGAAAAWWAVAGLAAGLAGLSKYSSLFLGPGLLLWLASSPAGRARLRSPGPWLALALAAAVFGLNIAWNATHGWLTFAKQFGRIAPHRFAPRYLGEFLVAQVVLINPLIAGFAAWSVVRAGREERRRLGLLLATAAPFALYLCLHSLHDRVQAHWPAPLYPSLAILAAAGAEGGLGPAGRRLRTAVAPVGLGVCAAALGYLALPSLGWPLALDPASPLRGWSGFAGQIADLRRRTGAAWVGATSYGLTAQLLDRPAVGAPVWQISERDRWRDLRTPAPDLTRPGLVVDLTRRVDPNRLRACFATVTPLGALVRGAPGERGARYAVVLVAGPSPDLLAKGCGG